MVSTGGRTRKFAPAVADGRAKLAGDDRASAHVGHWLVSLVYVAPVVLVAIVLAVQSRRERRGTTTVTRAF